MSYKRKYFDYHYFAPNPAWHLTDQLTPVIAIDSYKITISHNKPFTKDEADKILDGFVKTHFKRILIQKGIFEE